MGTVIRSFVIFAVLLVLASSPASAAPKLCLKESGAIRVRNKCKANQTKLGAANLLAAIGGGVACDDCVRHIHGSFYEIEGGFKRLLGFYEDSNGGSGSFVASFSS